MTDTEKIVAYKAAYKDLLEIFFKYYNTTKLYGVCFCETCCPVGWKKMRLLRFRFALLRRKNSCAVFGGRRIMKKRITITLSPEIIKSVKIEAVKADTKVSTLVEKLLKDWLEQRINKKD